MAVPTPHNEAKAGDIAKIVLMPGDPLRAKHIAENYLENPVCFNHVRNMLGFTGTYRGSRVSVMGHGMGIPSAGLYAYELYAFYGVEAIIRIGSAGGIAESARLQDVILATAASTNSNYAAQYHFPGQLAASASWPLLRKAAETAEALNIPVQVGQVFSSDAFYGEGEDVKNACRAFGVLGLEMETAGLYWTAQSLGKQALAMLTISDHVFTGESLSSEDRQKSFGAMMKLALETAYHFA
ncbi:MAG: purine-nucleoside phosphorylase [Oscillibacter sp.]|nr:purine-nucleoside phosphorylase [Oscillibacter sp.]